jgi:dolichyl-phosphate beta-glucosyltransferase
MTERNTKYLSIIIPAYNEAARIGLTLHSIDTFMKTKRYTYEIIVANDGSKDETASVVQSLSTKIPHLRLLDNETNQGKGRVIQQGMLEAEGTYRLFMDADGSTSIEHVDKLLATAEKGYDVVVSSRRIEGAVVEVEQSKMREMLGVLFRKIVHILVPLGVVDSQNGFKLFTAHAAQLIFNKQKTSGMAFDVEILAIAKLYGLSFKEEPIRWVDDERSTVTKRRMIEMLADVFKIKLNLMRGEYGHYIPHFGDYRMITLSKFLMFGLVNTLVDWTWYIALTRTFSYFDPHFFAAKGVAFLIASIPIFLGNAYWVFPKDTFTWIDIIKLYGILGAAFFINILSFAGLHAAGIPDFYAVILSTVVSFCWNLSVTWILLIKDRVTIPVYKTA